MPATSGIGWSSTASSICRWGFRLSGLMTYGSGVPFFVIDANDGFQPGDDPARLFRRAAGFLPARSSGCRRRSRLFNGGEFTLSAEVFNLTNHDNFGGADGFTCCGGNPNFGKPNALAGPPRSFQFGAAFRF